MSLNCVYLILEHLDHRSFDDLLNVARISDRFSKVAADIIRRKHSRSIFVISFEFPFPHNPKKMQNIAGMEIDRDTIERENGNITRDHPNDFLLYERTEIKLNTGDKILNTFQHFGHVIKNLELNAFSKNRHLQAELVGKLIDKYSSESSMNINIGYGAEIVMLHIEKPLINVENVKLRGYNLDVLHDKGIRFIDVFPAVRRLNVRSFPTYFLGCFDYHMPHLEHIYVTMVGLHKAWADWSKFPGVFEKNPQIQSVALVRVKPENLEKVNNLLPHLKTLTLEEYFSFNKSIQFENVTTFDASYASFQTSVANLHFPKLQTLIISCESRNFDDQLTFLNEHKHLSHLYLIYPNNTEFQEYTANLTDLVELTIGQRREFKGKKEPLSYDIIMEFLSSHHEVKRFNINILPDDYREQLKHGWNMKMTTKKPLYDLLSFERKTNH